MMIKKFQITNQNLLPKLNQQLQPLQLTKIKRVQVPPPRFLINILPLKPVLKSHNKPKLKPTNWHRMSLIVKTKSTSMDVESLPALQPMQQSQSLVPVKEDMTEKYEWKQYQQPDDMEIGEIVSRVDFRK